MKIQGKTVDNIIIELDTNIDIAGKLFFYHDSITILCKIIIGTYQGKIYVSSFIRELNGCYVSSVSRSEISSHSLTEALPEKMLTKYSPETSEKFHENLVNMILGKKIDNLFADLPNEIVQKTQDHLIKHVQVKTTHTQTSDQRKKNANPPTPSQLSSNLQDVIKIIQFLTERINEVTKANGDLNYVQCLKNEKNLLINKYDKELKLLSPPPIVPPARQNPPIPVRNIVLPSLRQKELLPSNQSLMSGPQQQLIFATQDQYAKQQTQINAMHQQLTAIEKSLKEVIANNKAIETTLRKLTHTEDIFLPREMICTSITAPPSPNPENNDPSLKLNQAATALSMFAIPTLNVNNKKTVISAKDRNTEEKENIEQQPLKKRKNN